MAIIERYLVRAKFEFDWEFDEGNDPRRLKCPQKLPKEFGPFRLVDSPNAEYYLMELGWVEDRELRPDWQYPVSLFYLETELETDGHAEAAADDILEQLEAMFRLFQKGNIYLRRHGYVFSLKNGKLEPVIFIRHRSEKAEPATLYARGPYPLDDQTFERFMDFFNLYWDIVNRKPPPLYNAIFRFNTSYERRSLSDRLIELMIAMEALFGDKDYQRYKIPLRCACMLHPLGELRKQTFEIIKKFYDERSAIIHGGKLEMGPENKEKVDQFEEYVRLSILKFLDFYKKGSPLTSGAQLDDLLFLTGSEG